MTTLVQQQIQTTHDEQVELKTMLWEYKNFRRRRPPRKKNNIQCIAIFIVIPDFKSQNYYK